MIGEYRFFQDYFDGQIVTKETENFKMFKTILVSVASALGLFLVFARICNVAEFLLLEAGMIWNLFLKLNQKTSLFLGIFVGFVYFFFASNFAIYANALIYVACYIPFQLIAVSSKDYEDGEFIQVRKNITDLNKILFVLFFAALAVVLALFSWNIGGRFVFLDALSASLLVCSAILRNERYSEYYIFRIFALILSIVLWVGVAIEYGTVGATAIIVMYGVYLIYDIVHYISQLKNYKNEYMLVVENYKKVQDEILIDEKLKLYSDRKNSENLNEQK